LSTNTTLTKIKFSEQLSQQETADLVAAVQTNYGLEAVCTYGDAIIDSNAKSMLNCIPRLNKAGRCYLTDDPTSRVKGVAVLEEVIYDLDCLFLHLQENPLLCLRQEVGRKRKADESR
jgi:NDP-sugar pyrophosphorylase family protein